MIGPSHKEIAKVARNSWARYGDPTEVHCHRCKNLFSIAITTRMRAYIELRDDEGIPAYSIVCKICAVELTTEEFPMVGWTVREIPEKEWLALRSIQEVLDT